MTTTMRSAACLYLSVATLLPTPPARAHPGAVADGRATCGTEYSDASTAYEIPDLREAWYIRRVATCESPVFWTGFDIEEDGQEAYIAAITPEIKRFEDELQFHAIWYGPGLTPDEENGLLEIPAELPDGVVVDEELAAEGAGYMTNAVFDSCDFVDTNNVMQNWSDLIKGRCSEEFQLGDDFSDPLQQGATELISWWLYSFDHTAAQKGTYRLQTWLTSRDDATKTAQGKYEMTLGPWTWSGYASDSTLDLAQSQGTSCACAVNAWDYKETYLERLGDLPEDFEIAQLPGGSCSGDDKAPASPCATIPREPYMSVGSAVEWSGLYELEKGREHEMVFRAYYQGTDAEPQYGYPDPGMFVYMVAADDVESVAAGADAILTNAVETEEDAPSVIVAEGETLAVDTPTFIKFTDTEEEVSTTILIEPDAASSTVALFTQHVPSEFMAHALRDAKSGEYIFPKSQTLYFDDAVVISETSTGATPATSVGSTAAAGSVPTVTGITVDPIELGPEPVIIEPPEATATAATQGTTTATMNGLSISTMATAGTTTSAAETDATPYAIRPLPVSYCTWGPNYNCFVTGWPSCCEEDPSTCPKERPKCEFTLPPTPPPTPAPISPAGVSGSGSSSFGTATALCAVAGSAVLASL